MGSPFLKNQEIIFWRGSKSAAGALGRGAVQVAGVGAQVNAVVPDDLAIHSGVNVPADGVPIVQVDAGKGGRVAQKCKDPAPLDGRGHIQPATLAIVKAQQQCGGGTGLHRHNVPPSRSVVLRGLEVKPFGKIEIDGVGHGGTPILHGDHFNGSMANNCCCRSASAQFSSSSS